MYANPFSAIPHLAKDLERVEACLEENLSSEIPLLDTAAKHLNGAGGKRIRPTLTLTAGLISAEIDTRTQRLKPAETNQILTTCDTTRGENLSSNGTSAALNGFSKPVIAATAIELVHLGSLYHDDVIDGAETRRSVPSANHRFGNTIAILTGDLMIARACSLTAGLGSDYSIVLSEAITGLISGQVKEISDLGNLERNEADYLAAIEGKTAALLSCACSLGAMSYGHDENTISAFAGFGHAFGMAFQITDDVLDCVGSSDQLGKPAGNDLLELNFTLPVIYALAAKNSASKELRKVLSTPPDNASRDTALEILASTDAIDQAQRRADSFAREALQHLEPLPDSSALSALHSATEALLKRSN